MRLNASTRKAHQWKSMESTARGLIEDGALTIVVGMGVEVMGEREGEGSEA